MNPGNWRRGGVVRLDDTAEQRDEDPTPDASEVLAEPLPLLEAQPTSEPVPPAPRPPPRVFSAVLAPFIAIPIVAIVSGIATAVPAIVIHWQEISQAQGNPEVMQRIILDFVTTPLGLVCSIVPAELAFLAMVLFAVRLSPQFLIDRLALHRPRTPWWAYVLFALASPALGMIGAQLASLLRTDESESIGFLFETFQKLPLWLGLAAILIYSVSPGICEEMFFRGYVQSRLLKRWHPVLAIGFASVFFSLAHIEPAHALLVFPLGVWMGVIAWRTGSIWPSITTHTLNNAYGVTLMVFITVDQARTMEAQWTPFTIAVTAIGGIALLASSLYLFSNPPRRASYATA